MKVSSQDWELRSELRRPAREGREQMQRTKIKLEEKEKKRREKERACSLYGSVIITINSLHASHRIPPTEFWRRPA